MSRLRLLAALLLLGLAGGAYWLVRFRAARRMAEASEARAELLAALEARGISRIQAAMAGYADAVQGVQLQAAAFAKVGRAVARRPLAVMAS